VARPQCLSGMADSVRPLLNVISPPSCKAGFQPAPIGPPARRNSLASGIRPPWPARLKRSSERFRRPLAECVELQGSPGPGRPRPATSACAAVGGLAAAGVRLDLSSSPRRLRSPLPGPRACLPVRQQGSGRPLGLSWLKPGCAAGHPTRPERNSSPPAGRQERGSPVQPGCGCRWRQAQAEPHPGRIRATAEARREPATTVAQSWVARLTFNI